MTVSNKHVPVLMDNISFIHTQKCHPLTSFFSAIILWAISPGTGLACKACRLELDVQWNLTSDIDRYSMGKFFVLNKSGKLQVLQIGKNIFIPYFTNHGLYKKLFCFLLYWCLLRFHEKNCAVFENWCQRKRKYKRNIDAQNFSWNRGVTKWIHTFWRVLTSFHMN